MESQEKPQGLDTTFRRIAEPVKESEPEKPAEVTGIIEDAESTPRELKPSSLSDWETVNGKYGLAYLGIKNIASTIPVKFNFSTVDNFIKAELEVKGYDQTPESWQNVLKELEEELGTSKLDAIERLQRLANYIKVVKKYREIKAKKESFRRIPHGEVL